MVKLQKGNLIKKIFILGLAAVLLYKFLGMDLTTFHSKKMPPRCQAFEMTEKVSHEELKAFLKIWPQYLEKMYHSQARHQISLYSSKASDALPWHIRFWLFQNCWEADRFYYVEQRLHEILQTSFLHKHTRDVVDILQKLMGEETDPATIAAYEQLIDIQKKIVEVEKISPEELEMVEGRETKIENILKGSGDL